MEVIRKNDLDLALGQEYRQYLAGHLSRPQPLLKHIEDDIEVGMSLYTEFTADKPHFHPECTEHGYVLSGAVRVKILDTAEEEEFREGDFFLIRPNVRYASKNAPGTRVLFIKAPGKNDKMEIVPDEMTKAWLSAWDVK